MKEMLIPQVNGYKIMTLSVFRLVSYKLTLPHKGRKRLSCAYSNEDNKIITRRLRSQNLTLLILLGVLLCLYRSTAIGVSSTTCDSYSSFLLWTVAWASSSSRVDLELRLATVVAQFLPDGSEHLVLLSLASLAPGAGVCVG